MKLGRNIGRNAEKRGKARFMLMYKQSALTSGRRVTRECIATQQRNVKRTVRRFIHEKRRIFSDASCCG